MKKVSVSILLFFISFQIFATHNRAGEITYRQVSGLTFEVTIITYTATGPGYTADRPQLEILWGDNTKSILPRVQEVYLPDYYKRNKYVGTHTFPGPGLYTLVVEDPNRNYGVSNIPNSVNTVFSITTTMYINPNIGINNTPVLTRPPLDKAAVGQLFVHNPGAYDPDGDSLSYKLTVCRAENGQPISGYSLPAASDSIYVDPITGDLVWDTPVTPGIYNVAMLIEEWRDNIKIGEIIRDMQIEVFRSDNVPPVIESQEDICIEAGTFFQHTFSATDRNNDSITLTAAGGPLVSDNHAALFYQTEKIPGYAEGLFQWSTNCNEVRRQPYSINLKAEDNSKPVVLVHMKNVNIYVVGPAVKNVTIGSTTNSILLDWDDNGCSNVTGYNIYRRISSTGFVPDSCETGVPERLGYTRIAYVSGFENTYYEDMEVAQGNLYCYLICAVFPDNAESYASEEVCESLVRGIPTITNVSVVQTNNSSGEIYVAWSKPTEIEIGEAPGPYQYLLYRSTGLYGEDPVLLATIDNIDDTTYNDTGLDTRNNPYSYKVEFYNNSPGNRFLIGSPHIASSVYINIQQMESALKITFEKNVPWINNEYRIFRYDHNTLSFEDIGIANEEEYFVDEGLINGREYCYYVRSEGAYTIPGIINPIINLSQEKCEKSIDTTPPCPPILTVESKCYSKYNQLSWQYDASCHNDVEKYNIYYTPYLNYDYQKIAETTNLIQAYDHYPTVGMAGCYYLTAIDSFQNESPKSNVICIDNCTYYELPNAFSPNGDGINDYFQPIKPYYFVTEIDIKIYNRWGQLLYETNDPEINWNGTDSRSGKPVATGVYFYDCDVYEQRLTGIEIRHLQGFVHVFDATELNDTNNKK